MTELSRHPNIAKVTFTGSTADGREILRGAAETFKRVTLELGGKGPNTVLDDADLDLAIPAVLRMGFINSGQACVAGTRIRVPNHRQDEILFRLKREIETFKVGAPDDPDVMIGPMVSQKQCDRVQPYIELGRGRASLLTGGPRTALRTGLRLIYEADDFLRRR